MNSEALRDLISAAESLHKRLSAMETDGTEICADRVSWALEGLQQAANHLILLQLYLQDGVTDGWTEENVNLSFRG